MFVMYVSLNWIIEVQTMYVLATYSTHVAIMVFNPCYSSMYPTKSYPAL